MTLQNRVNPWGNLIAVNARGKWLGNRGILHNREKEIIASWKHKAWVTCQLEFKQRKRQIFGTGSYSELFFLDEATAFSAGHRPCAECRRERYVEFKKAWCLANAAYITEPVPIAHIDKQLHRERVVRDGSKATYAAEFQNLPFGVFIELHGGCISVLAAEAKEMVTRRLY